MGRDTGTQADSLTYAYHGKFRDGLQTMNGGGCCCS